MANFSFVAKNTTFHKLNRLIAKTNLLTMTQKLKLSKTDFVLAKTTFIAAGMYNLSWVIYSLINPNFIQQYYTFQIAEYPVIFGLLKVIVTVLGISYFFAAIYTSKLWALAPFSILAKSLGAVLAFILVEVELAYPSFYRQVLFNDVVWLPAMGYISYQFFKAWQDTTPREVPKFNEAILHFRTQDDKTLKQWQETQPVMLVFLRHFGCTFCKEALGDLAQQRTSIEKEQGVKLIFVHMAKENYASEYFTNYGLADAPRISDPTCTLYEVFDLQRASFSQVFGLKSWWRGATALLTKGHSVGKLVGDGFRMPGVFVVYKGEILQSFKHETASDIPPYQELASCPIA